MAARMAVLAQPGIGHRQRIPVRLAAENVDGRAMLMAVAGASFSTIVTCRPRIGAAEARRRGGTPGGSGQVGADLPQQAGVVSAAQAQDHVVAGVMLAVEAPHVVERYAAQALDPSGGDVSVRRAGKNRLVQHRLGEFLVAGVAEPVFQVVDCSAPDPIEVLLAEGRHEDGLHQERIIFAQVVLVDAAGDDGHFHRGRGGIAAGQRKQAVENGLIAVLLGGGLGEHGGSHRGQPLLARRVVLRADLEPEAEGNRWVGGHRQQHTLRLRQFLRRDGRGLRQKPLSRPANMEVHD